MTTITINDEAGTLALGVSLARYLGGEGSVHIFGALGAGKTTLCRGILRGYGYEGAVKSPTFTLVEPYKVSGKDVFHFDLYRLSDPNELEYIGIDEYFGAGILCLIEWPERAHGSLPQHDVEIHFDVIGKQRKIDFKANSLHGEKVCQNLKQEYYIGQ